MSLTDDPNDPRIKCGPPDGARGEFVWDGTNERVGT